MADRSGRLCSMLPIPVAGTKIIMDSSRSSRGPARPFFIPSLIWKRLRAYLIPTMPAMIMPSARMVAIGLIGMPVSGGGALIMPPLDAGGDANARLQLMATMAMERSKTMMIVETNSILLRISISSFLSFRVDIPEGW